MDKILFDHRDVNVAGTYVYTDDSYVTYVDKECTTIFTIEELRNAFLKGAVIVSDGGLFKPTAFLIVNGYGVLKFIDAQGVSYAIGTADPDVIFSGEAE